MTETTLFLLGVGTTAVTSLCAVAYLTPALKPILVDLCGTRQRADFWAAFSNVSLMLMPLIFALHQIPESKPQVSLVFQLSCQIEWAFIGLVATVLILGFVIGRFIPRAGQVRALPPITEQQTPKV